MKSATQREEEILDFVYQWLITKRVPISTSELAEGIGEPANRITWVIRRLIDQGKLIRTSGFTLTIPRGKALTLSINHVRSRYDD